MMSKEREIAILQDYIAGMKTTELVSKYKVSTSSISKLLKKYSISSKNSTSDDVEVSIYNEVTAVHADIKDVANRHNLSTKDIQSIVRKKRNEHIIDDYKSGTKLDDICIKYKLSNMAIYKILNANTVARKKPKKRKVDNNKTTISDEEKQIIIQEYNSKEISIKSIMSSHGISKYKLYSVLYEAGCNMRTPTHFTEEIQKEIINEYKNGASMTELGYKYKASRALISLIVKGL